MEDYKILLLIANIFIATVSLLMSIIRFKENEKLAGFGWLIVFILNLIGAIGLIVNSIIGG